MNGAMVIWSEGTGKKRNELYVEGSEEIKKLICKLIDAKRFKNIECREVERLGY